jgi:TonB family protein
MINKILALLFSVFISVSGIAQGPPPPPPPPPPGVHVVTRDLPGDTNETFTFAEQMPEFIGEGGFSRYLSTNVKYPAIEKEAGRQGTVYIGFVVEKDGSITNVKERKGVPGAPGFTKEGIRVISSMPKWKPGRINGQPVRVEIIQPIRFKLNEDKPVNVQPSFPGGDTALAAYLKKNLVYPTKEKKKHKEGTVVITFTVKIDGTITNVQVKSEVPGAPGFTKEALRLINAMPNWNAGTANGLLVQMPVEVSVDFKL